MRIDFSDTPIYCLTCEDEGGLRRTHMKSLFEKRDGGFEFVQPIIGIPKNKSGASGFFRMVERGLRLQSADKPFRPFLLLEDDVSISRDFETTQVEIPDNSDLLYVGLSNCSMNAYQFHYANYYTTVDSEVVRIKHMLSTHGILVCSVLGASVIKNLMIEVYLSDKSWDIPLALIQPFYNVYALRRPMVYQDANYGGDEGCTRITLEGKDNELPEEWITRDLVSIKMGE